MPFFSKVFKSKDTTPKKAPPRVVNGTPATKPLWSDAWIRTRVDPEEAAELLRESTAEFKSRALDTPFLLLPFRPSTDTSAARNIVRNYFSPLPDRDALRGSSLFTELKMADAMVLASVIKWCWSRLPGGVITWETYEMFRTGERESHFARDAFSTFIPISVESDARVQIIRDFFDLLAAIAAHGKSNGLAGHKLSRYAGWWAFEHYDTGKGFQAGYDSWSKAADATNHLFFAYLRSMSPESGKNSSGILGLPRSLQQLVDTTEYPPEDSFMSNEATKVVMIVDVVSPTPYALLRRAKNFEYRDDDHALQEFASFNDPVLALTDECQRVLNAISSVNQSTTVGANSKLSRSLLDPNWSRFEDLGFGSAIQESEFEDEPASNSKSRPGATRLRAQPRSPMGDFGRPTTPSWADFLSSGFVDDGSSSKGGPPVLLPPDKFLPPIDASVRGQSSQSHVRHPDMPSRLEPGELASINKIIIDDAFWWVWISSLASEEPTSRKAAFGRCALIETILSDGKWMVMEEQVKGAAPEPQVGAYVAEKKGFSLFSKRGRLTRRRSAVKKGGAASGQRSGLETASRTTLAPAQQAKITQAAAELSRKHQKPAPLTNGVRRGRENIPDSKTNSVLTLQPLIKAEASPALQWASQYDKTTMRAKYLGDTFAGKGSTELLTLPPEGLGMGDLSKASLPNAGKEHALPPPPPKDEPTPQVLPHSDQPVTDTMSVDSHPQQPAEPAPLPAEPAIAADPVAVQEAAQVALPNGNARSADPVEVADIPAGRESEDVRSTARAAEPPSPTSKRLKKKIPGPPPVQKTSGMRRLFGTKRSKSRERSAPTTPTPPKESPKETNPAILAARRALEGKGSPTKERSTQNRSGSPQPRQSQFNKLRNVNSPIAAVQTVTQSPPARPATPPAAEPTMPEPTNAPPPVPDEDYEGPPRTRRDEEYDQLSRVDTNEREHADREFSTFDQGPLVDQPAFVPQESPSRSGFFTPEEEAEVKQRPQHQSVYSAVTMGTVETDDGANETPDLTQQTSPSDRWAQIRKNAADRAARVSEDQSGRSRTETRTDDGETSGEETIESRVARIKARVAELTGNMDGARR